MLLETEYEFGKPPIILVRGKLCAAGSMQQLCSEIDRLRKSGHWAVCIDLSRSSGMEYAAAFCIVELATRQAETSLAFFSAPKGLLKVLRQTDMLRFLNIHLDEASAVASVAHRSKKLVDSSAVVLCAGFGTRMGPLSHITPKPMLDVLGKPILARLVDHLEHQGIGKIALNPGHLGSQIPQYFKARNRAANLSYYPEGDWHQNQWISAPMGSASTLLNLYHRHHTLSGDIIVMCGDALTDIDLVEMMSQHKRSGAKVTIAAKTVPDELVSRYGIIVASAEGEVISFQEKPKRREAKSNLANVGIYIISESVLAKMDPRSGLDIAEHLLAQVQKDNGSIYVYRDDFEWLDVGCGRDYAAVVSDLLSNPRDWLAPEGQEISPSLWVHDTAVVERKNNIQGPAYIGRNAQVDNRAKIKGPTSIGQDCVVSSRAFVEGSIILQGTQVSAAAICKDVIASNQWTQIHANATHKDAGVTWITNPVASPEPELPPLLHAS